jgi:toluene methyl-monooxygenase electron transfer component
MDWLPRKDWVKFQAHIDPLGRAVEVEPGETLLQAALRSGVAFPHSCRVGSCATCKCRLVAGNIKSMTDTSYVLDTEEVEGGFILACQSILKSDIRVFVERLGGQR